MRDLPSRAGSGEPMSGERGLLVPPVVATDVAEKQSRRRLAVCYREYSRSFDTASLCGGCFEGKNTGKGSSIGSVFSPMGNSKASDTTFSSTTTRQNRWKRLAFYAMPFPSGSVSDMPPAKTIVLELACTACLAWRVTTAQIDFSKGSVYAEIA